MEGMTYLTVAYLGMIAGIAIWTWTVVNRSKTIEARLESVESNIGIAVSDADEIAKKQAE
jgi:hypothetical protein